MAAENFAILFSGGGSLESNFPRYYRSTLSTYNALVSRGVDPNNIAIAFGPGYDSDGISKVLDLNYNQYSELILDSILEGSLNSELESALSSSQFNELSSIIQDIANASDEYTDILDDFKGSWQVNRSEFYSSFLPSFKSLKKKIEKNNQFSLKLKHGNSSDDPTKINFDIEFSAKSNFSEQLNEGAALFSGKKESLKEIVESYDSKIDANDSLFVWTFDHGGIGGPQEDVDKVNNTSGTYQTIYTNENKANLTPWNDRGITAREFSDIFQDIALDTFSTTFAFTQCFSGGLVQEMLENSKYENSKNWIALAASNQHEESLGSSFADGVSNGLQADKLTGQELFEFAKNSDEYAAKSNYFPNSYTDEIFEGKVIEHPWSSYEVNGIDRPLFVDSNSKSKKNDQSLKLANQRAYPFPLERPFKLQLSLQEDSQVDLVEALRDEFDFKMIEVKDLILPRHGTIDGLNQGRPTEEAVFIPSEDYNGFDSMVLTACFDDKLLLDITIEFEIQSVNDAPIAVDDFYQLQGNQADILISIDDTPGFLDDTDTDGDYFFIQDFTIPKHGSLSVIDETTFSYSPNPGFTGIDEFLYVISDGEASDLATITLKVLGTD